VQAPGANPFAIDEFVIEYRNNGDYYDSGLPTSVVVINHGRGGRGNRQVQSATATFIGEIRLHGEGELPSDAPEPSVSGLSQTGGGLGSNLS
jgi:hypothetical protein